MSTHTTKHGEILNMLNETSQSEGYILYNFNYVTFWKMQNYRGFLVLSDCSKEEQNLGSL